MKIALCLSGGLRNFKDTQYSFQEYLLSTHDIDIFFMVWKTEMDPNQL